MSGRHKRSVGQARACASSGRAGRAIARPVTAEGTRIMTVQEIANDLVALCREGKFAESGEKYWAQDVLSVEAGAPAGGDPASRGIEAARGKGEWWSSNHDVHAVEVEGPYVNG